MASYQKEFDKYGKNLIFLISQPRAGSTMLQRVLGNHPDIHTVGEPWLMLYPAYTFRPCGHQAEYEVFRAQRAMQQFFEELPGGEYEYDEGLRQMHGYLYSRALTNTGSTYFLDKTPRYYLIIPELHRIFPEAHFIILLRNPLAVLVSIFNTWIQDNWFGLHRSRLDLKVAPKKLLEGVELLGNSATVVQYERFVTNPELEIETICRNLKIQYYPELADYNNKTQKRWEFGDPENVYKYKKPLASNANKWQESLIHPQIWRACVDYLDFLGRDVFREMGYSFEDTQQILHAYRPSFLNQRFAFPLNWLLREPFGEFKNNKNQFGLYNGTKITKILKKLAWFIYG